MRRYLAAILQVVQKATSTRTESKRWMYSRRMRIPVKMNELKNVEKRPNVFISKKYHFIPRTRYNNNNNNTRTWASHIQFSFTYEYEFIFFLSIIFSIAYVLYARARPVSSTIFIFPFILFINNNEQISISFSFFFSFFFFCFIRSSRSICSGCSTLYMGERVSVALYIRSAAVAATAAADTTKQRKYTEYFSINIWTCFFFIFLLITTLDSWATASSHWLRNWIETLI